MPQRLVHRPAEKGEINNNAVIKEHYFSDALYDV